MSKKAKIKKLKKRNKYLQGCYDVQYHNLGVYQDMNERLETKNKQLKAILEIVLASHDNLKVRIKELEDKEWQNLEKS